MLEATERTPPSVIESQSVGPAEPIWSRLLAKTRTREVLVLIPVLVLLGLKPFAANTDPDYWWHVRTGQYIYEMRALPAGDPFSFTVTGQAWVTHEWLTELILFLVASRFGYVGNVVLFGAINAATWLAVYATCRRRGVGEVGAILLMLWGCAIALGSINVRPQMVTALFVAVFALLLTRYRQSELKLFWSLPLLMVLWVNLHGGYIIGLALLGVTVAGELLARIMGRPSAPLRPLLAASAVSAAATLVNPHGIEALWYPFTYAGTANASMRYIAEWQSPDFHQPLALIFGGSLLLAIVLGVGRRPLGPSDVLWTLMFGLMGLQSIRHIALYGVVVTPLLGARLQAEVAAFRYSLANWRQPLLLVLIWPAILTVILSYVVSPEKRAGLQLDWEPSAKTFPAAAVAYLRTHDVPGHLFNDYGWGGYLIYQLYPQRSVFIDGRMDVYGDAFAERYLQVAGLKQNWRQVLDEHDVRVALVGKNSALATALGEDAGWQEVVTGDVERLFIRSAQ